MNAQLKTLPGSLPIYIFDLDGTLANMDHRLHLKDDRSDPNRWETFYRACERDAPIQPVINIFDILGATHDLVILTGRSSIVRKETTNWLETYLDLSFFSPAEGLIMRPEKNRTPDHEWKRSWYESLSTETQKRIVGVFEDRQRCVDMWRFLGIQCMQVAPGDF